MAARVCAVACAAALSSLAWADRATDVSYTLVPRGAPSAFDSATMLPPPATQFAVGDTCYLEVWCTDLGSVNTGLISAYVDLGWSTTHATAQAVAHRPPFTLFSSGTIQPGSVDELGGSDATLTGQGIAPLWARLSVVTLSIDALGDIPVSVAPASTATACLGRGVIPPGDISVTGATLNGSDDVAFMLRVTDAVTGPDQSTTLPESLTCVPLYGTYFVEVWVSDVGSVNTGLTSAYLDLSWNVGPAIATNIVHRPPFTLFPSGTIAAGLVDELGGSDALLVGQGVQPVWARVAAVEFLAATPGTVSYAAAPAATSVAAFGRGVIPSANIVYGVISVNVGPAATASNSGPYCVGETIELSASGGTSYAWTGPAGFSSTLPDPTIPDAQPENAGVYTVVVTDDNGCSASAETTVVVYANPAASASNSGPYCVGETIELSASGGTSYAWTGPAGFSSTLPDPTIPDAQPENAGVYTVVVTDDNGCSASAETTVVVYASPAASASNSGPYCVGETIELSASGGTSYAWTGPAGFSSTLPDPTIPDAQPENAGVYTVVVTDDNGCSASAETTVVVYANPAASASNSGPYCVGETIELSASGGTSYAWTGPAGFSSTLPNPTIPDAQPDNAGVYTVVVTDDNGCSASAETTVEFLDNPPLPEIVATPSSTLCAGGSIELSVVGTYETYVWSTGATTPSIIVTAAGVYGVSVANPSVSPCTAEEEIAIVAGIGARGDSNCDGAMTFDDIDPFVAALSGEAEWAASFPSPPACSYLCVNDINQDGAVDFDDIDPFVACLGGLCP
ncbi:MAG: hypothetical protein IPM13_04235 [Phycisphaerales bacterium]|nr:hypothetical protein [Phycisphaerales bacterium]